MRQRMCKWWILGVLAALLLGAATWVGVVHSRGPSFQYSNLVDDASRQQAQSLLSQAEVPSGDTDAFFELVDAFYRVPYEGIVESGWKKTAVRSFAYDDEAAFAHNDQSDCSIVCRTAAYLLTRSGITFGGTDLPPAEEKDPKSRQFLENDTDRLQYDRLFASIPAGAAETSEQVWDTLKTYWTDAGISFREETAQLVTVYALTGNEIQNLHAAAALYGEDGVWLLEKYDPLYPFQFSHFEQERDMIDYLQRRAAEVDCAVITRGGACLWEK